MFEKREKKLFEKSFEEICLKTVLSLLKKVFGITKVMVPSREHPVVPYFVVLLKDSEGRLSAVKSFKEFQVGDDYSEIVVKKSAVSSVGVVGTGVMGCGIAALFAGAGLRVVLKSRTLEKAEACRREVAKLLFKRMDGVQAEKLMQGVVATASFEDLRDCGVVVESVSENPSVKKQVFNELDAAVSEKTVLATNTSSLSVTELSRATAHPERVVGMHFFNPVSRMLLVEVVAGEKSSIDAVETVGSLALEIGKVPIAVKDSPGFIVNRLLLPFLNDAVKLLEQGVASREEIDSAVKLGLNHPMGPLELVDLIGIDVFVEILREFQKQTGNPHFAPARLALEMLAEGKLGRKTKQGFYEY